MKKNCGEFYSGRATNDYHAAVKLLDQFTKTFCIDAEANDEALMFRCDDCPFEDHEIGTCAVKIFKNKFCPDYKDFGCMGDL